MPVYLVHGFRWPREGLTGIRVHAVVHNLDDCSVEYIQNENSRTELLASFRKTYPEIMHELEGPGRKLEFIEQYNPEDVDGPLAVSQPWAFVGDKVVVFAASPSGGGGGPSEQPPSTPSSAAQKKPRPATQPMSKAAPFNSPPDMAALSVNVEEVVADGPGLTNKAWEALADLRDKIAEGEKIGWWVVYNGDPDRSYDYQDEDEDAYEYEEMEEDEDEDVDAVEGDEDTIMQPGRRQQQQRPLTGTNSAARPPTVTPHIATQQQQGLTALPMRPNHSDPTTVATQFDKGNHKDEVPQGAKDKQSGRSLRRKFFGKRS
jgi:hypothetical protein